MKHLKYAIVPGALFTILFVAGLASGMEFKDKMYGGKWDWLDWIATIIGGTIGQAIQVGIILLLNYAYNIRKNSEKKYIYYK